MTVVPCLPSITSDADEGIDIAARLLSPLRQGKGVTLSVTDKRLSKKRRIKSATLFLTPGSAYGGSDSVILASMPGYGSELFDIYTVKPMVFYRVGLSMRLSRALVAAITDVFQGVNHGS